MNKIGLGMGSLLLLGLGCSGKLNIGPGNAGGAAGKPGNTGGTSWEGGAPSFTGGVGPNGTGGFTRPVGGSAGTCIPGKVAVEAQGTPAEATVRTLDRCDEGYACDAEKTCVPIAPCAGNLAGDCLIYETASTRAV